MFEMISSKGLLFANSQLIFSSFSSLLVIILVISKIYLYFPNIIDPKLFK